MNAKSHHLEDDHFHDHCGVFGIFNHAEASKMAYLGLYALQHRGQESAGILSLIHILTYGVKSLFKIIGNACPVFNPLFAFKPFVWLMSKVYAFISYNRRVIIPAGENDGRFRCV